MAGEVIARCALCPWQESFTAADLPDEPSEIDVVTRNAGIVVESAMRLGTHLGYAHLATAKPGAFAIGGETFLDNVRLARWDSIVTREEVVSAPTDS